MKKLLRPLPRKTNIHRYPILKWFAGAARNRAYLWSFRTREAIPAIYAGCILTCLPLNGIQLPVAFALALLLRANLPILVALQFASNMFTIGPLYFADYWIGDAILSFFNAMDSSVAEAAEVELREIAGPVGWREWLSLKKIAYAFTASMVGGFVIGWFFGVILALSYRYAAWKGRGEI